MPDTIKTSRRALLAGAPAVAAAALAGGAVALGIARTDEVDPIFEVIANHVAATERWFRALNWEDEAMGTPEHGAADEAVDAGCERAAATARAVLTTQPTTLAGVAALLAHVGRDEFLGMSSGGENDTFETLLSSWSNAIVGGKAIAQEFPLRLAAALRNIIERGQA
jgi:hypothetical protein